MKNAPFAVGDIVQSKHTKQLVKVTGEGQTDDSFAGIEIGKPRRFCVSWYAWRASAFNAVEELEAAPC